MSIFVAFVSFDKEWINAQFSDIFVEQKSGTGTGLSVDICNIIPDKVTESPDILRIALLYKQALQAVDKVDKDNLLFRKILLDVGYIVFASLIQEMRSSHMGFAFLKGHQASH